MGSPAIELIRTHASPTAVVATSTTWAELPALWPVLLDEVWSVLRAGDVLVGHNVMVYEGDPPTVEIGVGVGVPITPVGRVVPSTLPAGTAARAVHDGPPSTIGTTHEAIVAWCRDHGHRPTGRRWEIYGDPGPDGAFAVEVYWQVADVG